MSVLNIQNKVSRLNQTLQQVEVYRKQWTDGVKARLFSRLGHLAESAMPAYWYAAQQSDEANRESVFLVMPTLPSGIYNTHSGSHYVQHGGYLQFIQTINGQVSVLIWYPYVEGITTVKPPTILKTLPPNEISDQVIDGFVETFVDAMDKWFLAEEIKFEPIGFKLQTPLIA